MKPKAKGGKKNRKFGRNESYCTAYKNGDVQLSNKIRKIRRHLRQERHKNDTQNLARYTELSGKQSVR